MLEYNDHHMFAAAHAVECKTCRGIQKAKLEQEGNEFYRQRMAQQCTLKTVMLSHKQRAELSGKQHYGANVKRHRNAMVGRLCAGAGRKRGMR